MIITKRRIIIIIIFLAYSQLCWGRITLPLHNLATYLTYLATSTLCPLDTAIWPFAAERYQDNIDLGMEARVVILLLEAKINPTNRKPTILTIPGLPQIF